MSAVDQTVQSGPSSGGPPAGDAADAGTASEAPGATSTSGAAGTSGGTARPPARLPVPRARRGAGLRLFRSELGMVFRRRRNQILLLVLAAVPVLIAIAVKVATPRPGEGPPFSYSIVTNGLFVAFTALTVSLPLFLPLVVAVAAGDSVAGEAGLGTLRYLLVVPVSRTRLVVTKYAGIVAYCFVATLLISAVGAAIGLILFPAGKVTLLSGSEVTLTDALWRLLLVALYVGVCIAAVGAIGLFVSTLTESGIAAMAATAVLAIISEVLDTVPQIGAIHPYLFSHYWLNFGDLLRAPIAGEGIARGLLAAAAYIAIFGSLAWARFSTKDVSG